MGQALLGLRRIHVLRQERAIPTANPRYLRPCTKSWYIQLPPSASPVSPSSVVRCSGTSQDRRLLLQDSPIAAVLNHSTFKRHKVAAWRGMSSCLHSTITSFTSIPQSLVSLPDGRTATRSSNHLSSTPTAGATRGNQPRCTQHHPVSV